MGKFQLRISRRRRSVLPGRPAIELKSRVGSFGNNVNNRTEEAIGNAADIWRAYEEGFSRLVIARRLHALAERSVDVARILVTLLGAARLGEDVSRGQAGKSMRYRSRIREDEAR